MGVLRPAAKNTNEQEGVTSMLYSIRDTMGALSIGRTSVYNLIKAGRLEAVKLGSRTLIKVSSIHALVEANSLNS
jgi:excisionase family DNA binding protein